MRVSLRIAAGVLSLFVVACGQAQQAPPANTNPAPAAKAAPFKVAFNTWIGYSPLLLAREKGFLKAQGLEVEISMLEGIGEKNAALIKGTVDAVGHTADAAVVSAASGVDGQVMFIFDQSWGSDGLLTRKSVKSIKDLKGKRVALEPGFTGHFFFLSLLKDAGMKPADVQIVAMETGQAGSTFVAGGVDAAQTWEPWLGKAKSLPNAQVLVSSADKPGRIIDVLYMNRRTIEGRSGDVVKLVQAMGQATDWYATNKAEGDAIMAKFWKLSPQEQADTVAGMRFMTLAQNREFFGTADQPGPLFRTTADAAQLWIESDVIKTPVDAKSLIAFDVITKAVQK
jgi:NitT/TauT family transport system substrate-binding protein